MNQFPSRVKNSWRPLCGHVTIVGRDHARHRQAKFHTFEMPGGQFPRPLVRDSLIRAHFRGDIQQFQAIDTVPRADPATRLPSR